MVEPKPQALHSFTNPSGNNSDELVVEGGTDDTSPTKKKRDAEELYLNLYPSTSTYGAEWSALFAARTKDGASDQYETKLYSQEQVKNLDKQGLAHRALHDCEFTVKKWEPSSPEGAAVKAFAADVSGAAFTRMGEHEKEKETEEEKAARLKRNKTKQAIVLCCMLDQIVSHMLTSAVKKSNIELELIGDSELVQAAYVYLIVGYSFDANSIKCKDHSGREYSADKITLVKDETHFGQLIKNQHEKYAVADECLKTMYKQSAIKVGGAGTQALTNFEDLEKRFQFFDSKHNTNTAEAFKDIVKAPSWLPTEQRTSFTQEKPEAISEQPQASIPEPSAPPQTPPTQESPQSPSNGAPSSSSPRGV